MAIAVKTHYKAVNYRGLTVMAQRNYDPTHTTALRNSFAKEMRKRFRALRGDVRDAIVNRDVFGLTSPENQALVRNVTKHQQPGPGQFDFPRSSDKINAFMDWLKSRVDEGVLEVRQMQQVGQSIDNAWANTYIKDSYQRGVIRGRKEMRNARFNIPSLEKTGGINASMGGPFHADRLGVLYTRTFNELKGITDAMDQQISRVLTQGISDGDNPRKLAEMLNKTIKGGGADLGITDTLGRYIPAERRAQIMARTEIIRAHHKANIQEYRNWGVEGIKVKAEWITAGDQRVCARCETMALGGPYTLNQIENEIPKHPQCRCVAIPIKASSAHTRGGAIPNNDII